MDWLESPEFPRGFYTFLARPPGNPRRTSLPRSVPPTNGIGIKPGVQP
jgi:hypothetical protein